MGLAAAAYQRMMTALLPPGALWNLSGDSLLSDLFLGCADELERFDGRVGDMLDEADPSTAVEMLSDYERELDLEEADTTEERQARIVSRLVARQRYRPVDFQIALAPLLGLDSDDVDVVERTHAIAVSMGDVREIYRFFIYRDPDISGTYFLDSAQELINKIKPTHTAGQVIESIDFLCDDAFSLCDRDLLGA